MLKKNVNNGEPLVRLFFKLGFLCENIAYFNFSERDRIISQKQSNLNSKAMIFIIIK